MGRQVAFQGQAKRSAKSAILLGRPVPTYVAPRFDRSKIIFLVFNEDISLIGHSPIRKSYGDALLMNRALIESEFRNSDTFALQALIVFKVQV